MSVAEGDKKPLAESDKICHFSIMNTETEFSNFRRRQDLTLNAVADLFGVNRRTILRWEQGISPIPLKRLAEVEAATGISRQKLRPDIFGAASEAAE